VIGREQDRRQEEGEHDLRRELEAPKEWQHSQAQPGDHHQDRVRHAEALGEQRHRRDHGQEQQDELEHIHGPQA
jgi:hypothetical protein